MLSVRRTRVDLKDLFKNTSFPRSSISLDLLLRFVSLASFACYPSNNRQFNRRRRHNQRKLSGQPHFFVLSIGPCLEGTSKRGFIIVSPF